MPTSEDPSLNEVGGISDDKSEEGKVSGVDPGLLKDEPTPAVPLS